MQQFYNFFNLYLLFFNDIIVIIANTAFFSLRAILENTEKESKI